MGRITIRINKEQLKKLKKLAKSRNLTLSDIVRQALEEFLEARGMKPLISSTFLQYDNIDSLIRRIEKLERQVEYLSRKLGKAEAIPKEIVIKRTTGAEITRSMEGIKDLLNNPWAEILKKKESK